jgi:hypothetical protein
MSAGVEFRGPHIASFDRSHQLGDGTARGHGLGLPCLSATTLPLSTAMPPGINAVAERGEVHAHALGSKVMLDAFEAEPAVVDDLREFLGEVDPVSHSTSSARSAHRFARHVLRVRSARTA